ncbi:UNVERIFIED_CONTAM: hypothetical protein PYX00_007407 [Menopon gallinae]|uniref:Cytochrome P450 307A1 n=1 Tax=Menopon gallinae TaxID=328185 RepID=A0AAW2HJR2_9NEOP
MFLLITFSLTIFLFFLSTLVEKLKRSASKGIWETAPGPRPYPIIGSLYLLGKSSSPFEVFTQLAKKYGSIYSITLGMSPCVVVNSFQHIKEVLISKGGHFGGRPDFIRFHQLFGGDRNNSLALCDWSELQKTRRSIARFYCSPRFASANYDRLNQVGLDEIREFLPELSRMVDENPVVPLKPLIMAACANMFTSYMCSTRFSYGDPDFVNMVKLFDEIFWEINQGYAVDFMPWLLPFYNRHMKRLRNWSREIRQFILSRIIDHHRNTLDWSAPPRDFTDALLLHLEKEDDLNWQHIMFELEDFLGGHSAIGNLVMLTLAAIVKNPEVGARIQAEIDQVTSNKREVNLFDKTEMPYTEATILETLRTSSSPIVPHVANQDTSIGGYFIKKGCVVFLNNYELNTGEQYWSDPLQFKPERFISNDKILKPEYFIPFSTGKRTCIGQRLVQGFSFVILAAIMQNYNVTCSETSSIITYPACVALPPLTFSLKLTRRPDRLPAKD